MRPDASLVMAVVALAACLASAAHGAENGKGYIYDAVSAGDNRAVIVNRATGYVGIQDKRDAHVDVVSAFGGFYDDCGNDVFFCLAGPLDIIIPKSMSMTRWKYKGLSCEKVGKPEGDTFRVTCSSSRLYHTGTSFTFSRSRGVLLFGNSRVGGTRGGFVLRGQRGLFSQGNNP